MKTALSFLFIFLCIISTNIFAQQEDGLVAFYPFSGSADDTSGNDNHGVVDGPQLTTDRFGNANSAYEFNGIDDIIRVLDDASLRLEEDFTLVAWVMPYSQKDHTIFRKNSSQNAFPAKLAYGISLAGTQHFVFNIGTDQQANGISSQLGLLNQPYEINKWYRIIARQKDNRLYMTTNEFEETLFFNYERPFEGDLLYDSSPLLIGSRTQQAANTFEGKIDDIKIYNRLVSLEEITGLNFTDDPTSTRETFTSSYNLAPNPFNESLQINSKDFNASFQAKASLYTIHGHKMLEQSIMNGETTIDTKHLPAGTYLLVINEGEASLRKLVIKGN